MSKKCFVVMPISGTTENHSGNYWAVFFDYIKSIMEESGYDCIRSEAGPYRIFNNIVKEMNSSDVNIVVLTDHNSNVLYELGISHTLKKKGTIMLLQQGQKMPFDFRDYGLIMYADSIGLEHSIKSSIKDFLCKMECTDCDSPVFGALDNIEYNNVYKRLENLEIIIKRLVDETANTQSIQKSSGKKYNRILWVDDCPENNESVISYFENIKFDIAFTTEQGLDLYKSVKYDMIITDMRRGEESDAGLTLLRKLNEFNCKTPVIVFSSYKAIRKYGDEALRLGACNVTNGVADIISLISDIMEI